MCLMLFQRIWLSSRHPQFARGKRTSGDGRVLFRITAAAKAPVRIVWNYARLFLIFSRGCLRTLRNLELVRSMDEGARELCGDYS